jgi:hypothetical protein
VNTLTKPALAVFRWPQHGDLRAVIELPSGPLFFAEDVCNLLELDVPEGAGFWGGVTFEWPGRLSKVEALIGDNLEPVWLYTVEDLRFVADNFPTYMSLPFLDWFDQLLALLNPDGTYLEPPEEVEDPAKGRLTFSIARAARVLSRDPRTSIGREALFDLMRRDLGWIARDVDAWVPTIGAETSGVLLRERPQRRPGEPREAYAQVRVTTAGVEAVHRALGGVATLQLEVEPQPTLLDV